MVREELINYLKECRARKISLAEAKKALIKEGWKEKEVDEAIKVVKSKVILAPPPAPIFRKPVRLTIMKKIKGFIANPVETFRAVKDEPLGKAFGYYALLSLITPVLLGVLFLVIGLSALAFLPKLIGTSLFASSLIGLLITIGLYGFSLINIWISGLIVHLGVLIFIRPNQGIRETYKALMYGLTPFLLFGWVPFLNYLIAMWAIILEVIGLKELHKTSVGKAIAALVIILLIIIIIGVILVLLLGFLFPLKGMGALG